MKNRRVLICLLVVLAITATALAGCNYVGQSDAYEAPERKDWDSSLSDFEHQVASLPPEPSNSQIYLPVDHPPSIGGIDISRAERVPGGVLFYDTKGCGFLDDAGIAYLTAGPHPDLDNGNFERPQYRYLSPGWYSFCASW